MKQSAIYIYIYTKIKWTTNKWTTSKFRKTEVYVWEEAIKSLVKSIKTAINQSNMVSFRGDKYRKKTPKLISWKQAGKAIGWF